MASSSLTPRVGLTGVTHGLCTVIAPTHVPDGEYWRYGLGFPVQLSPTQAGIFANIHRVSAATWDYEAGTDMLLFDDLRHLVPENAIPLSRNHRETHPDTGQEVVMVKYPMHGGFVPLGATRADGSPHPHAGTGFGICVVIAHAAETDTASTHEKPYAYLELCQLSFDGHELRVTQTERIPFNELLPGVVLVNLEMGTPVPDGDDFLGAMVVSPVLAGAAGLPLFWEEESFCGLSRWQRGPHGWHPVDFVPVTDVCSLEPSVVRDVDGTLLFTARPTLPENLYDALFWRSRDNGKTWERFLTIPALRQQSPMSLAQAVDGTPFFACNLGLSGFINCLGQLGRVGYVTHREILCLWPFNPERDSLLSPFFARSPRYEFGPPPVANEWYCDHPSGANIRLADGRWHSLLCYRIMAIAEGLGEGHPPTPHSGMHVEEVFSSGDARPAWNF